MNEYWQQQHGLTTTEKAAFVDRVQDEQSEFLRSLRNITDSAENRMLTRVARERGPDDDDADDASLAA